MSTITENQLYAAVDKKLEKQTRTLKLNAIRTAKILMVLFLWLGCYFTVQLTRILYHSTDKTVVQTQPSPGMSSIGGLEYGSNGSYGPNIMNSDMAGDTSFIQSLSPQEIKTRFTDVGGMQEAKAEIKEVVDFLKNPDKFERLGAETPKGVLLVGPSGTGKTLLARAVAGEAEVSFLSVSGASFQNGYIGTGAARIKLLFEEARKRAPAIVFVDEIDSMLPRRTFGGMGGGDQEYTAMVNQFLAEMDGIEKDKNKGVIVMGATNKSEAMDEAALRPGRFDRHLHVTLPTLQEREEILKLNLKKMHLEGKIDILNLARNSAGFSGADLKSLVNEAAIFSAKQDKKSIDQAALEYAKDKVMLGRERPSIVLSAKEKEIVAYHESGHALVGLLLKQDPLQKITIIPRSNSLGVTVFAPLEDNHLYSKDYLEGKIAQCLGGYAAEELIFGSNKVTTGPEDDLRKATELAYNMVTKWGLSKLGVTYQLEQFDKNAVEVEVRSIVERHRKQAKQLLEQNIDKLHALAKGLLERETLEPEHIQKIMAGA